MVRYYCDYCDTFLTHDSVRGGGGREFAGRIGRAEPARPPAAAVHLPHACPLHSLSLPLPLGRRPQAAQLRLQAQGECGEGWSVRERAEKKRGRFLRPAPAPAHARVRSELSTSRSLALSLPFFFLPHPGQRPRLLLPHPGRGGRHHAVHRAPARPRPLPTPRRRRRAGPLPAAAVGQTGRTLPGADGRDGRDGRGRAAAAALHGGRRRRAAPAVWGAAPAALPARAVRAAQVKLRSRVRVEREREKNWTEFFFIIFRISFTVPIAPRAPAQAPPAKLLLSLSHRILNCWLPAALPRRPAAS